MTQLIPDQLVNYRYSTYPLGRILKVNKDQVLLEVDSVSTKFRKWVHWTSVSPNPSPTSLATHALI